VSHTLDGFNCHTDPPLLEIEPSETHRQTALTHTQTTSARQVYCSCLRTVISVLKHINAHPAQKEKTY